MMTMLCRPKTMAFDPGRVLKTFQEHNHTSYNTLKRVTQLHVSYLFPTNLQCLLNMKRPIFKQSRTLLFLSGILLFCSTKIFRLSDSCPATSRKIREDCPAPKSAPTAFSGQNIIISSPSASQQNAYPHATKYP